MKLVIDTNNIIAALIKNGISRRIIVSPVIDLITPDHTLQEISKYEKLICEKAKVSSNEFKLLINLIFEQITIVPKEDYIKYIDKSKNLIDDINDVPFIALCLATKADGVWSDDKHFKSQKDFNVYRTKELAVAFIHKK